MNVGSAGLKLKRVQRKVTKYNQEYMLDGYHYVGMESALNRYCGQAISDHCCWVYAQRSTYKGFSGLPDQLDIVARVVSYDEEMFIIEVMREVYINALPNPKISIAFTGERDEEKKEIRVSKITGLYIG